MFVAFVGSQPMNRPQVIFFDAVGTLFGVRGGVGQVYQMVARRHGVELDATRLNLAFYQCFKAAPPCTFPGVTLGEIRKLEFQWWLRLAEQTFSQAGALQQFRDFPAFFSNLYAHFETAEPWFVYPDTVPTLEKLQRLNIPTAILSNFDSRLYAVLKALDLEKYFDSVTISTEVGVAKPDPKIFSIALAKYNCSPADAWHIGDSVTEDYEAAKAAGLKGILLRREEAVD